MAKIVQARYENKYFKWKQIILLKERSDINSASSNYFSGKETVLLQKVVSFLYKAITKEKWDKNYVVDIKIIQSWSHTQYQKVYLYLNMEFEESVLESGYKTSSGEGHNCKIFFLVKATLKLLSKLKFYNLTKHTQNSKLLDITLVCVYIRLLIIRNRITANVTWCHYDSSLSPYKEVWYLIKQDVMGRCPMNALNIVYVHN